MVIKKLKLTLPMIMKEILYVCNSKNPLNFLQTNFILSNFYKLIIFKYLKIVIKIILLNNVFERYTLHQE